ncbi:MAG: response regulator transcription factor [Chloroflexi bacterium]|nr:response regulator transcription factor [Chloroflexota bacterium]
MLPTTKILVVDDEANIRTSLKEILARDGYHVVTAESGEAALALLPTHEFDLALLDLQLTGIGGIEVLAALREQSPTTIAIVLTAHASLETAVEALRKGAHDYLFKPCKPAELRESIRKGLVNRQGAQSLDLLQQVEQMTSSLENIRATILEQIEKPPSTTVQPPERQQRFLQQGKLIVDLLRHVITMDGHLLDLSPTEFDLLACLISKAPQIVSPQELVREVQGYESDQWEASETIRQHIYRIRQKIKQVAGHTNVIRTVRGVGYTIDE